MNIEDEFNVNVLLKTLFLFPKKILQVGMLISN